MRQAPPAYDQKDQQDVRNEISDLKRLDKPVEAILMPDTTNGRLYYVRVTSGAIAVTAAST